MIPKKKSNLDRSGKIYRKLFLKFLNFEVDFFKEYNFLLSFFKKFCITRLWESIEVN